MSDAGLPAIFSRQRITVLVASIIVALCSGTNYVYSAYSPQLGERLHISHTQLNIIGLAGNVGVYFSGPVWGRVVDKHGPRYPFIVAFVCLLSGYAGIAALYGMGVPAAVTSIPTMIFVLLVICSFVTGSGSNAGVAGGINSTAKTFPDRLRATTTGLVLSGFGLSAFLFSTIAHTVYPGDTAEFLVVLALGTSFPMLLGLILVKPIPLPASELAHSPEYEELEAEAAAAAGVNIDPHSNTVSSIFSAGRDESRARLLSDEERTNRSSVELSPSRHRSPSVNGRESPSKPNISPAPNVFRMGLFKSVDFWLLCSTLALLSGTGLMYINNVGSMSQALYAHSLPAGGQGYSPSQALKWQSTQVSTVSVCNFAGRVILGLVSDFTKNTLKLPRSYCMILVSLMVLSSQLITQTIEDVNSLWKASAVMGLSYGGVFALFPSLCIEWFGLPHFSENWGYISVSPAVGGNLFSIAFGRNLDAHEPITTPASPGPGAGTGTPPPRQCLEGRACYVDTLRLTIAGCILALLLSVWASWRDRRRIEKLKEKQGPRSARDRVVWEGEEV